MADTLGIGTSGLLAFQRSMATISHNISNANTEGYSRQRTQLDTQTPQGFGYGFMGSGVKVSTVERIHDQFLVDQVRSQTTKSAELNSYYDMASRVDNLLSDPDAGISPMLQEFFDAAQGVADSPGSVPARQVMLTTAESLTQRMATMYDGMDSLNRSMSTDIKNTVAEINGLATSIANINEDIVLQSQRFGQPPNDLLDQRDEMLRELGERISVSTVAQDDGAVNVFIGNGQSLVVGNNPSKLIASIDQYDPSEIAIELGGVNSTSGVDITGQINGGSLGGMLKFKEEILDPSLNQLGRVATGLASAFNAQHVQGMTLNDTLGTDFFTDFMATDNVTVLSSDNNSAAGQAAGAVTATLTDITQLTAQDYVLRYEGGDNFSLMSQPTGTVVDTFNAPNGSTYTTAEGFEISINAGLTTGDRFEIRPTRTAAKDFGVLADDVTDIAAAGAVRAYDSGANQGNATISAGELITDPADPEYINFFDPAGAGYIPPADFTATVSPVTIDFRTSGAGTAPYADEYSLDGGTTWQAYTSGADIKLDGMKVQISGTPIEGDEFTMEPNTGAVSDNRNMLELAGLQNARTLVDGGAGPTVDFQGAYGQLVSMVGTKTHQADVAGQAQESLLNQAVASREAVSGVNLDEEAANLLRFQQAYQATARVVTSAQTMFQSLLDAVR